MFLKDKKVINIPCNIFCSFIDFTEKNLTHSRDHESGYSLPTAKLIGVSYCIQLTHIDRYSKT